VIELLGPRPKHFCAGPPSGGGSSLERFRFAMSPIDFKRAEVTKNEERVELSAMEFKLLQFLIENRGTVHSRDQLFR